MFERIMTVTKIFEFEAAHVLGEHPGKCKNIHGHNYTLHVGITGRVNEDTGMVLDFGDLKTLVKSIIDEWDHAFIVGNDTPLVVRQMLIELNYRWAYIDEPASTAECMLAHLGSALQSTLKSRKGVYAANLRLYETPTSYVDYSVLSYPGNPIWPVLGLDAEQDPDVVHVIVPNPITEMETPDEW